MDFFILFHMLFQLFIIHCTCIWSLENLEELVNLCFLWSGRFCLCYFCFQNPDTGIHSSWILVVEWEKLYLFIKFIFRDSKKKIILIKNIYNILIKGRITKTRFIIDKHRYKSVYRTIFRVSGLLISGSMIYQSASQDMLFYKHIYVYVSQD